MNILDCLTPRTVTVTGARVVRLGINEPPHGRYRRKSAEQAWDSYDEKRKQDKLRKRKVRG